MTKESCGKSFTCHKTAGAPAWPRPFTVSIAPRAGGDSGEEIALADRHAAVAQDVVGGGDVEVEIRQRTGEEIGLARNRLFLAADLDRHLAVVAAGEVLGRKCLDVIERLDDAGLELGESLFVIGPGRRRPAGKPG